MYSALQEVTGILHVLAYGGLYMSPFCLVGGYSANDALQRMVNTLWRRG
jgi:hypothetical protein